MSPSEFRNSVQKAENHFRSLQKLNDWSDSPILMNQQATMTGTINATVPFEGLILIGLFAKPIPEGLPIYGTLVSSLGDFYITDVKPGVYYLNGNFCFLGNAGHGLFTSAKNLTDPIEKANHSRIVFHRPTPRSTSISSTARRSTHPNLFVSVDESFSSESS